MAYNVLIVEDQDIPRELFKIYIDASDHFDHFLYPDLAGVLGYTPCSQIPDTYRVLLHNAGGGSELFCRSHIIDHGSSRSKTVRDAAEHAPQTSRERL